VLKYYTSRQSGNAIDAVMITGGSSQMKGMTDYMSDALGLPVGQVTQLNKINMNHLPGEVSVPLGLYINAAGALIRK